MLFLLGEELDRERASSLVQRYREIDLDAELRGVRDHWDEVLGTVQVETPVPTSPAARSGSATSFRMSSPWT